MTALYTLNTSDTYLNPVYNHSFPDPFVLKHRGEYWGYCTGFRPDGRCFGVLHSRDLVDWREVGSAMEPLPVQATCYWAPEVVYENGRFLMYYSVGNEEQMEIRVAVSEHPAGPFVDSGRKLTTEEFAIDPHVFFDEDGSRYLFYATDFLEHTHIGTGTVVDAMIDPFTLAGRPRPVTRANHDWQVYDPRRAEKGGVRWYTVEGPCVLKHKSIYYQMFSGGNWKNVTYGVSYATNDHVYSMEEWKQAADGDQVLLVLRTIPGKVIGPGHNSAVRGPDNRQLFCIYHRWSEETTERVMAIDPLDWAGPRMLVIGPSTTPQPAPNAPTAFDFFDEDHDRNLGPLWDCPTGQWRALDGEAIQAVQTGYAEARCRARGQCFLAEVSLRSVETGAEGGFGLALNDAGGPILRLLLAPSRARAVISTLTTTGWTERDVELPLDFEPTTHHLLRCEVDGPFVQVALDSGRELLRTRMDASPQYLSLITDGMAAAFAGFSLTAGWEDLFTEWRGSVADRGWQQRIVAGEWFIRDQQLWCRNTESTGSFVTRGPQLESYEMVVNVRLQSDALAGGCYGFYPALEFEDPGPLVTVNLTAEGWSVRLVGPSVQRVFPLPASFDPARYQQFRFRKIDRRLLIQWETEVLGEAVAPAAPTQTGLYVYGAETVFDLVRVTAIQ
jgi:GH43 family beta-xylosidase